MTSRQGGCGCRQVLIIVFAASGVILLVVGLVLSVGGVFSNIIKNKVDQNVELKPGGLVYKEWVNTTTPVYMQYFVFHLVNPEEVFAGTAIPTVKQMGPYSYREIRTNEVLNWTSDKSIVTFMPNRTYIFDPTTSCAGCDDKNDTFVTVNIPLLTTALWLKNNNYDKEHAFCFSVLKAEAKNLNVHLFQNRTVFEILWGYTDPFLEFIIQGSSLCPGPSGLTAFVQLQYNNTYYGISAVNTGRTDISKLEQYTMWRGEPHLSWWSDRYANMINGTDGTQFAPDVTKDDTLYAFSPEVCRSFYFVYESEVTVRDIKLYRFTAPDELYKSGDVYAPNKGFCVPPDHPHCLPTGLLNISGCQPMNPPVVASPPHFYQGNESLLKSVHGLHPTKSADETYVDVEPITGIVMRAAKRIQINVDLESVDILPQTNGTFEQVFLPVMFANESALISEDKAAEFRHQVYLPIKLTKVAEYLLIGLGCLFILVALVLLLVTANKTKGIKRHQKADRDDERKPLVDDGNKVYT